MTHPATDQELAAIQGSAAGTDSPLEPDSIGGGTTLEFMGEKFRIADSIGLMPLLKFSDASSLKTNDVRALSAMYSLIKDTIYAGNPGCGNCADCKQGDEDACRFYDEGDWDRFERHAIDTKADEEDLFDFVTKVIQLVSGRPTRPRHSSSAGRGPTSRELTGRSSARRGKGSRR